MITIEQFSDGVYNKYEAMSGGFPCGKCLDIAKEINEYFSGKIVGGLIGSGIQHWWFELDDGTIIDPMYQFEIHEKIKIY